MSNQSAKWIFAHIMHRYWNIQQRVHQALSGYGNRMYTLRTSLVHHLWILDSVDYAWHAIYLVVRYTCGTASTFCRKRLNTFTCYFKIVLDTDISSTWNVLICEDTHVSDCWYIICNVDYTRLILAWNHRDQTIYLLTRACQQANVAYTQTLFFSSVSITGASWKI